MTKILLFLTVISPFLWYPRSAWCEEKDQYPSSDPGIVIPIWPWEWFWRING